MTESIGHINPSDVLFIVTKDTIKDIVMSRNGWVDVEWTDELVNKHMKDFERSLEWGLTDALHEVVIDTAVDIECAIAMEVE
jgi:hypothetical protein